MVPNDIHQIRFAGGPLDSEQGLKTCAELFNVIGLAACVWARLELFIDAALIHINQPQHSEKLHDQDHPIGFRRKIKLLKRWYNQHPALAEQRASIRKITSELLELSTTRNQFLHSILDSYDPTTQTAVFRSIRAKTNTTYEALKHVGTLSNLLNFAMSVQDAHRRLGEIFPQLFNPDVAARLQTP
jgi:hypothetical protein